MVDPPHYEQPPGVGPEPFWSASLDWGEAERATLRTSIVRHLAPGEQLRGVFGIAKIRPALNVLVVTDRRVAAGWGQAIAEKGWVRLVLLDDLAEVEVDGSVVVNLCLVGRDGKRQKVGSLQGPDDRPALVRVLAEARRPQPPGPVQPAAEVAPPVEPVEPSVPPYLSTRLPSRADGLDALLGAIRAHLDPGEVLYVAMPVVKVQPTMNLLVVTDRRVAAGWGESLTDDGWLVTVPILDLEQALIKGMMDNVKLVASLGPDRKVGSLQRTEDVEPLRRAFHAAQTAARAATDGPATTSSYEVYRPPAADQSHE